MITDSEGDVTTDSMWASDGVPDAQTKLIMKMIKRHRRKNGLSLSAETPALAATPAPLGKPGGPGLYHMKGAKLPNYIENIRNALMRGGMSEGRATATAINSCKRLAATSKHPEVKAAAAAAIAELKATAARAKSMSRDDILAEPVELFNTMHVGAGASNGGQFAAKAGSNASASDGTKTTKNSMAKSSKAPPPAPAGKSKAERKAEMLGQAKALRTQANGLQVRLNGLVKQLNSGKSTSHGGSKATGTTTKGKTATTKKAATTTKKAATTAKATAKKATTTSKTQSTQQLKVRIAGLRVRIQSLRTQAATIALRAKNL